MVTGFDQSGAIICANVTTTTVNQCPTSGTVTFGITSTPTGDPIFGIPTQEQWPGGTQTMDVNNNPNCTITVTAPSGDIDLVGTLGDGWAVTSWTGFTSATGVVQDAVCNSTGAFSTGTANNRPSCSSGFITGTDSTDNFVVTYSS